MQKEDLTSGLKRLRIQAHYHKRGAQIGLQLELPSFIQNALKNTEFLQTYFNRHGWLAGLIMIHKFWDPFYGRQNDFHFFFYDIQDPDALQWMQNTIETSLPCLTPQATAVIPSCYQVLWPALKQKGFGIEGLMLCGSPQIALDYINSHNKGPHSLLQANGLEMNEFKNPDHIDEVAALRRQVFSDHPDFCIFYHNPGVDEEYNKFTKDRIQSGRQWELRQGKKLVGFFGYGIGHKPFVGKSANMDFAILKDFHGKRLGWFAYRVMLQEMIREKVVAFSGATSNPAVMHMSLKMQRDLHDISLMHSDITPSLDRYRVYLSEI